MTIAGQHSVTELKALLANKDSELADMAKAVDEFGDTWKSQDPNAFNAWNKQYLTLKYLYNKAYVLAKAEIFAGELTPFISDDNIPAETGYQQIISSLQQTPGVVSSGDFQDLFNRIQAARNSAGLPAYEETPLVQPTKGSDTDLNLLQSADQAAKALDKAGKAADKALPSKATLGIGIAILGIGVIGFTAMQLNQFRKVL